jgi:cell shape-determining protein MreC
MSALKTISSVKVEGTNFIREVSSMGLSNMDVSSRDEYYNKVRLLKGQKQEINSIKSELSDVRNDITEIKEMLSQLIGKGSNG